MRGTCVSPNVTRSTKLRGMQRSLEVAFSSRLLCSRKPNFPSPVKPSLNLLRSLSPFGL